ncbi:MAG: S24 family peptidase [Leptospiraceae bacterium]
MARSKKNQLHPTQQKLLDLLKQNIDEPLSYRELMEELNLTSPNLVRHHILQLEEKGHLWRNPGNTRDYKILSEEKAARTIVYINRYGSGQCGPNGSVLDGDPVERIPLYSKMIPFPPEEAFALRAKGDSMMPRINPGDLLIARISQTADAGDLVVCVNQGQVLIKKYVPSIKSESAPILQSINSEKYPAFTVADDFRIEGIVKLILSTV